MSCDADQLHRGAGGAPPQSSLYAWFEEVLLEERSHLHSYLETRHESMLRRLDLVVLGHAGREGLPGRDAFSGEDLGPQMLEEFPGGTTQHTGGHLGPECEGPLAGWGNDSQGSSAPRQHDRNVGAGEPVLEMSASSGAHANEPPLEQSMDSGAHTLAKGRPSIRPGNQKKNVLKEDEGSGRPRSLRELVLHPTFEVFFTSLIILSAVVVALELQYWGYDAGLLLGHHAAHYSSSETWPWAAQFFDLISPLFGFAFVVEVVLKILGLRCQFLLSGFNLFDFIVVVLWLADYFAWIKTIADPVIMRLVRLARVMRIARVVRHMHGMDQLYLIVASVEGSISILCWATVLLTAVMTLCALFLVFSIRDYIENGDVTKDPVSDLQDRLEVYNYFGSFTRAMLSMFEMTLGNWIPPCRTLVENISEWYAALFIIYKCVVGFAIVKVITGVFMCETFKVASTNDDVMIMQKSAAKKKHLKKMKTLFSAADAEGDGKIGWEEFQQVMSVPRVKMWLGAMELDVADAHDLFRMLDDGDHEVSLEELATGITKLKGASRSMDLHMLMHEHRAMATQLSHCAKTEDLQELHRAIFQLQGALGVGQRPADRNAPRYGDRDIAQSDPGLSARAAPAAGQAPPSAQSWRYGPSQMNNRGQGQALGPRPDPSSAPISPNLRMRQDRQRIERERQGRRPSWGDRGNQPAAGGLRDPDGPGAPLSTRPGDLLASADSNNREPLNRI